MANVVQTSMKNDLLRLPDASDFPSTPSTWYLFCHSSELKKKPLSKTILSRRLVAYRTSQGSVSIMDAHCAHLGADLGRGSISDDLLQCPFHHWKYSSEGQCVSIPNSDCIPGTALQRNYSVIERHGYIFFFYGPRVLFSLPFFSDCDSSDFVASWPFNFAVDSPWFMLVGNGFDGQHFQSVHDRRLTSPPRIDCPSPFARRMRFEAEVIGTTISDRLLRRFVGREVRVSITSWGGPYVLVEGVFGNAHSRLLVASQPVDKSNTNSAVIVFAKKKSNRLINGINLKIRRGFTKAFLQYDIDKLAGVRYQPQGLTEQDQELTDFFVWAAALPKVVDKDWQG